MKYAKVRCLALLADANSAEPVITELGEYAADIDAELARQAIRAVGKICLRLPGSAAPAIERLIDFMGMDVSARWGSRFACVSHVVDVPLANTTPVLQTAIIFETLSL